MTTLIVDNSICRFFLKEGKWTARFFTGDIDIIIGKEGVANLDISKYRRVVLTGSEASVLDEKPWIDMQMDLIRELVEKEIPLLGICFGHQLIARALGGAKCVKRMPNGEFGWHKIQATNQSQIFQSISSPFYQLCTHFYEVVKLPADFKNIASSEKCDVQAMEMKNKPVWGIQFHPEISMNSGKAFLFYIKAANPTKNIGIFSALKNPKDSLIAKQLFKNFQDIK